eukprot:TRINITY_DN64259_c0_g2_i1.p1 TRINITY_DN64259_c0_g2~~TRINITY_DN64259_c0_g2_i1.p1  ORF type:complete len:462 (-),score=36.08 TRINITY_DN64259_c0_g2_i1:126-1511(-)
MSGFPFLVCLLLPSKSADAGCEVAAAATIAVSCSSISSSCFCPEEPTCGWSESPGGKGWCVFDPGFELGRLPCGVCTRVAGCPAGQIADCTAASQSCECAGLGCTWDRGRSVCLRSAAASSANTDDVAVATAREAPHGRNTSNASRPVLAPLHADLELDPHVYGTVLYFLAIIICCGFLALAIVGTLMRLVRFAREQAEDDEDDMLNIDKRRAVYPETFCEPDAHSMTFHQEMRPFEQAARKQRSSASQRVSTHSAPPSPESRRGWTGDSCNPSNAVDGGMARSQSEEGRNVTRSHRQREPATSTARTPGQDVCGHPAPATAMRQPASQATWQATHQQAPAQASPSMSSTQRTTSAPPTTATGPPPQATGQQLPAAVISFVSIESEVLSAVGASSSKAVQRAAHELSVQLNSAAPADRGKLLKEWMVEYHPDKNRRKHAKDIFQFVNNLRSRLSADGFLKT